MKLNKFGLFVKFIVKDGELETMVNILLDAAKSMETIEDCEIYHVSISAEEENCVFVYEVWKDENAHKASLSLEVTQSLIKRAKPIIAGIERISTMISKGGKVNSSIA
jgi:quinol monooxygenase YgiN